jgi:hypothetical protein
VHRLRGGVQMLSESVEVFAHGVGVQRMRPVGEAKAHAHRRAAARNARVERVLDRLADQRVGEVLGLEEFVVHGIDVHFAQIHGAKVPGGEPGHSRRL